MDPWFYCACTSWFPAPDNRFLLENLKQTKFDYLYVSHVHHDHLDAKFLVDDLRCNDIKVLCANYRSGSLEKKMKELGFTNIILLDHLQSHQINEKITVTMYLDTAYTEDSGLFVQVPGFRFLNLNDCNCKLSELPPNVDVLATQYSGAVPYPVCYDFPQDVMERKTKEVRSSCMDRVVKKCVHTNAKWVLPSAGPPVFLDPALVHLNDRVADPKHSNTIFPQWEDVDAEFKNKCPTVGVVRVFPGDVVEVNTVVGETSTLHIKEHSPRMDTVNLSEYAELRKEEWSTWDDKKYATPTTEDVTKYFQNLVSQNKKLCKMIEKRVRFSTEGLSWDITFQNKPTPTVTVNPTATENDTYNPEYCLDLPQYIVARVLAGTYSWEDVLQSMRIKMHRDPDVYDFKLWGLLRFGQSPVITNLMARNIISNAEEKIEKEGYQLQRWCPHAGEDLTNSTISNGVVECPRHHWKWDVNTGKCVGGGNIDLCIKKLDW